MKQRICDKCHDVCFSDTECEMRQLRQRIVELEKLLRDLVVECEEGDWTDGTDIRSEDDRDIEETEAFKAARAAVPEETK